MEDKKNKKSELIPFKAPTKEMLKHYADLYGRNQTKWITIEWTVIPYQK